jgi:deoxyribodipyrimidine photo-lyase
MYSPNTLVPTRAAGLARLSGFVPRAGADYARMHGMDAPGRVGASHLSPYIRYRIVTDEEVVASVTARHGRYVAEKFLTQMHWRAYCKGWLQMRPVIWRDHQHGVQAGLARLETDADLCKRFQAACAGTTGIDGFDTWARDLVATGYLHGHARRWFASIWLYTLRLPWELGADFFLRHLLDGDPASNTLSWRWVAGLHIPGTAYLVTADTIARKTEGRFDPKGLATSVFPIKGTINPEAGHCPQGGAWDRALPTALLLHEDDLSPDWLLANGLRPVSTALTLAPELLSPLAPAPSIGAFVTAAMQDCTTRLGPGLNTIHGPVHGPGAVDALVAWARSSRAHQVVTPFAPVGPIADRLDEFGERLAAENIALIRAMRPYDGRLWPHATHGFAEFRAAVA